MAKAKLKKVKVGAADELAITLKTRETGAALVVRAGRIDAIEQALNGSKVWVAGRFFEVVEPFQVVQAMLDAAWRAVSFGHYEVPVTPPAKKAAKKAA